MRRPRTTVDDTLCINAGDQRRNRNIVLISFTLYAYLSHERTLVLTNQDARTKSCKRYIVMGAKFEWYMLINNGK